MLSYLRRFTKENTNIEHAVRLCILFRTEKKNKKNNELQLETTISAFITIWSGLECSENNKRV